MRDENGVKRDIFEKSIIFRTNASGEEDEDGFEKSKRKPRPVADGPAKVNHQI